MNTDYGLQKMRVRNLLPLVFLSLLTACSSAPQQSGITLHQSYKGAAYASDLESSLKEAEQVADDTGRKILITGREMTIDKQEIVRGSCWDYSNAVYNRSGFSNNRSGRITVFKGSKDNGPYADAKLIKPGDWLYYVNHSYGNIEHSAIFVKWIDFDAHSALMLSYGGEKRNDPARYLAYDLSNVYRIIRPAAQ